MILLGSGGHTAEMLLLLRNLKHTSAYLRTYVCTSGDDFSVQKAHAFEAEQKYEGTYQITCIPRARYVGQSFLSTPLDCVKCLWGCVLSFFEPGNTVPDVVIVNGPGSAVMLVAVALVGKVRIVYMTLVGVPADLVCVAVLWAREDEDNVCGEFCESGGAELVGNDIIPLGGPVFGAVAAVEGQVLAGRVQWRTGITVIGIDQEFGRRVGWGLSPGYPSEIMTRTL